VNFGATSGNVTVTAFNGCEYSNASSTLAVSVNPILTPGVTITANPGATICTGTSRYIHGNGIEYWGRNH
jgi:hypothetical protein